MNFSDIYGILVPEIGGQAEVLKIEDSDGNIIWTTLEVEILGTGSQTYCYIDIDEERYTREVAINVPLGKTIKCYVTTDGGKVSEPSIKINGEFKSSDKLNYTVMENTQIKLSVNKYEDKGDTLRSGSIEIFTK